MSHLTWRRRADASGFGFLDVRRVWAGLISVSLVAGSAPGAPPDQAEPVWRDVPVPGGAAGLARVVGLDPAVERWRVLYEVTRQAHAPYGELAQGPRLPRALSAHFAALAPPLPAPILRRAALGGGRDHGETRPAHAALADRSALDERLPLPLSEALWTQALLERPPGPEGLMAALLVDRPAALVYRGLATLDDETLRALARERALLRALREAAPAFSVFARSLSVRAGRVQVPGGADYVPLWEQAVGERVQRPARFVVRLAQRAEGRWLSLFDALQRLEPRQRQALLGGRDAAARGTTFETLAGLFLAQPAWWQPGGRPYARPFPDAALVLLVLPCNADGGLALPGGRGFWEAVFASDELPEDPAPVVHGAGPGPALEASWLVARITDADASVTLARLQSVRLAARLFPGVAPSASLLTTLRATARYPALLAVLEDLGFTSADDFAAALRRAQTLDRLSPERGQPALAQFQGLLALLQRAVRQHSLPASAARPLARALVGVEPDREQGYAGRLLELFSAEWLPHLGQAVYGNVPQDSAERTLLRALAGARLDLPPGPVLAWEGLPYRVDVPGAELRRLQRLRSAQGGPTLDSALGLLRGIRALEQPGSAERRGLAELIAQAVGLGASLRAEPHDRRRSGRVAEGKPDTEALLAPFRMLRGLSTGRPVEALRLLRAAADVLAADALRALAYLPHLGAPDGPALLGGHVARRHALGRDREPPGPGPWQRPEELSGAHVRWHVRGSLLGLHDALARLSLRRLERELPARPPRLYEPARAAGARAVAALVAADLTDAQRDALAAALHAGRARVAAAAREPARLVELGEAAHLPAWRLRLLGWIGAHEPEALGSAFTLVELLRLGATDLSADAWGIPAPLALGPEGQRLDAPFWELDDLIGISPLEPAAARASVDLHLRLAELFAELRLPAALLPAVLSAAALDFQEEAQPAYPEDALALARQAAALTRERVEDYVAALALDGPLTPYEDAPARLGRLRAPTGGQH